MLDTPAIIAQRVLPDRRKLVKARAARDRRSRLTPLTGFDVPGLLPPSGVIVPDTAVRAPLILSLRFPDRLPERLIERLAAVRRRPRSAACGSARTSTTTRTTSIVSSRRFAASRAAGARRSLRATVPVSDPRPSTHFEVLLPSGRSGWILVSAVRPLVTDRLCYAKNPNGDWRIAIYDQAE